MNLTEITDLMDWKRTIASLYATIREAGDPRLAWTVWTKVRDELFKTHPQSPIPADERQAFSGVPYFDYDPGARTIGELTDAEHEILEIGTSTGSAYRFTRFGSVAFALAGEDLSLDVYWLEGYGGGLFLPFRDATAGKESYGAGRYLFDSVKGADLGTEGNEIVLDFNFAYNPSCAYDPRWVCPLAPPANRLDVEIRAGERYSGPA